VFVGEVTMKEKRSMAQSPLLHAVFLVLAFSIVNPPCLRAITIDSFEEPFNLVLDNLMTNYWSAADDGTWLHDGSAPGDCAGYDAARYSTRLLFPLGLDTGNPLQTYRANRTVEHVIDTANSQALFEKLLAGQDISPEAASIPALIYGGRYYSGSSQYDFEADGLPIMAWITPLVVSGALDALGFNAYCGPAMAAYYQLIFAYVFRDSGNPAMAQVPLSAYDSLRISESYWVQVSEDEGYYYDPDGGNAVFNLSQTLQGLALAYRASGEAFYLDRASDLLNYLDTHPDGYFDLLTSSNHFMTNSLLLLYDATGDPRWLDRAEQVLTWLTGETLLIEDVRFNGYSIISHDWIPGSGPNPCACPGCNFAILGDIYEYNRLEQVGPSGVDPLLTCPEESQTAGNCSDGLDNDCDGLVDTDLDCSGGGGGTCAGSAGAWTLGSTPVYGAPDLGRHLACFLLPIGAFIGLAVWRRKK
jgi:hypothetical protein